MLERAESTLFDVVMGRRSIYRFTGEQIPIKTLDQLIAAAVWAPNHRLTEPWRFVVVCGAAKDRLATLRGEIAARRAMAEGRGLDRIPGLILEFQETAAYLYVAQKRADDETRRREDYAACMIAAYIVQLTAWPLGIGARWGTGTMATDPAVGDFLGLAEDEQPICYLGLGYPREVPAAKRRRQDPRSLTRYLD